MLAPARAQAPPIPPRSNARDSGQVPPVARPFKLLRIAIGVTAVHALVGGLAAVWFWPNANQPFHARARTEAVSDSEQEVPPTPKAPILEAAKQPPMAAEQSNEASSVYPAHVPTPDTAFAERSPAPSFQVAPAGDPPFLAPGERIAKVYPDGLLVEYNGGNGLKMLRFNTLPESIRRQYGYDPRKAAEYQAEQARAAAEYPSQTSSGKLHKLAHLKLPRHRRLVMKAGSGSPFYPK